MFTPRTRRILLTVAVAGGLVLLAWWSRSWQTPGYRQQAVSPLVMGTTSKLVVVAPPDRVQAALDAAIAEIRAVERAMSRHDSATPLSRFNQAAAGQDVMLDSATLTVMRFGQRLAERTGGAFDVTMLPLGQAWSRAGREGRLPSPAELADVRQLVGHEKLEVGPESARKLVAGLQVSLDAIAKGYAADRAVEAMKQAGAVAGLVEIGGDVRTFGQPAGRPIIVEVQNPFAAGTLLTLEPLPGVDLAVCTSGNYRRFVEIEGRRYSHIIDPRTGQPADAVPSVTVVAADAMTADGWATALSVLSMEDGRRLLESEPGVAALWITGDASKPEFHFSERFGRYVRQ